MKEMIDKLFDEQLATWELARNNYAALENVLFKEFCIGGNTYKVQFNPDRLISSTAKVDNGEVVQRKCFLCAPNLPSQQSGIPFGSDYHILVNPYPIFPKHLTIPDLSHIPQHILYRFDVLLNLIDSLTDYVVFYNGPKCGASAPDHHHFQAGSRGFLPIEGEVDQRKEVLAAHQGKASLHFSGNNLHPTFVIESTDAADATALFGKLYNAMETTDNDEPMMNIIGWKDDEKWTVCIFPRQAHRPACYFAQGDENMLISPGAADMGGVVITPQRKDFDRITAEDIATIAQEVCLGRSKCEQLIKRIKQEL